MIALIFFLLNLVASPFKPKSRLEAENAALRRQVIVLQRKVRGRVQFTTAIARSSSSFSVIWICILLKLCICARVSTI